MYSVNLNVDIGEYKTRDEQEKESKILSMVSRCNIACGGHVGNEETIRTTLCLAKSLGVSCGAHPSYPDTQGFGRHTISINASDLKTSLKNQIGLLRILADELDLVLTHVKPHGALYNDTIDNPVLAELIVEAIAEIDTKLAVMGLPNSVFKQTAERMGLTFLAEAYVDRRYTSNGTLVPRGEEGAVIDDINTCVSQALSIVKSASVSTREGDTLMLDVQTLCLHSDSNKALEITTAIYNTFIAEGFSLR